MKKLLTLALAAMLILGLATTGALAEETPTLSVWFADMVYSSTYTSQEESPMFQKIEELTGIDITWMEPAAGSDSATAYNLMVASGELPDVVWASQIAANALTYLDDETIIDLTPYFTAETMPNLYALCEANPSYLNAVKIDDGRMFGVPTIVEQETWQGPWVRTDWLEACGLDIPTTIDDWTEMLTAFKENYGATFTTYGSGDGFGYLFTGAYGVPKFTADNGFYQENGEIRYVAEQEGYREYLALLNGWYTAGLIDPDYVSADEGTVVNKAANGETGAIHAFQVSGAHIVTAQETYGTDGTWAPIPYPTLEEGGERSLVQMGLDTLSVATAITTNCEDVDTAVRFLDWLYSEEAITLFNFGIEGISFEYDENGNPQYTDDFLNGPDGMVENASRYTGVVGNVPNVKTLEAAIARNDASSNEAIITWQGDWSSAEWAEILLPLLSPTEEENDETTDILSALNTYVKESTYSFITGARSLEEWDSYVDELYNIGLETVKTIRQDQLDRVLAR